MADREFVGEYEQAIRELSERIVNAQKPIRILDALKWDEHVEEYFFKHKCRKLPEIDQEYFRDDSKPFLCHG